MVRIWLIGLVVISSLDAQEVFQRASYERHSLLLARISSDLSYTNQLGASETVHALREDLGFQLVYDNRLFLDGHWPEVLVIRNTIWTERAGIVHGDPSLAAGAIVDSPPFRLRIQGQYRYPLGPWDSFGLSRKSLGFVTGTGFHTFAGLLSTNYTVDPVVLNLTASYAWGGFRKERYGMGFHVGTAAVSVGLTELINEKVAVDLNVFHVVDLGDLSPSVRPTLGPQYRIEVQGGILILFPDFTTKVGLTFRPQQVVNSTDFHIQVAKDFRW